VLLEVNWERDRALATAGEAGKVDWFDVYQRVVWCVSRTTNHVTAVTFRSRLNHVRGLGYSGTVVHSLTERAPASERAVCITILLAGYEAAELPLSCLGTRKCIALSGVPGRDSHMVAGGC